LRCELRKGLREGLEAHAHLCAAAQRIGRSAAGPAAGPRPKRPGLNAGHYQTSIGARCGPVSCSALLGGTSHHRPILLALYSNVLEVLPSGGTARPGRTDKWRVLAVLDRRLGGKYLAAFRGGNGHEIRVG
jgi:hypothetical protein